MTEQQLIDEFGAQWLNGVGLSQLWELIKQKFVSGFHDQSTPTTIYTEAWRTQARQNIGLAASLDYTDPNYATGKYVSKVTQDDGLIEVTHVSFATPTLLWTNGTSAGPVLQVTTDGGQSAGVAIPTASASVSGVVTVGSQEFTGNKSVYGNIEALTGGVAAEGIADFSAGAGGGVGTVVGVRIGQTGDPIYPDSGTGIVQIPDGLGQWVPDSDHQTITSTQKSYLNAIIGAIPSAAYTSGNQLADKAFVAANYAHGLDIDNGYLRLMNNASTPAYLARVALNSGNGLVQLSSGKIPLSLIPDAILGQLVFGGTITGYEAEQSQGTIGDHPERLVVTLTSNGRAKLNEKLPGIGNLDVYLVNSSSSSAWTSTGYHVSYADAEGLFFIMEEGAMGTGGTRSWAGQSYEVGDWLLSVSTKWTKIDNTDAVTGVKGDAETDYRIGNVNITKANIGLGNVGDFLAVSTVASQSLTDTQKSNARANIGLGTASTHAHTDYVTAITWDSSNLKLKQSKGGGTATDIITFGAAYSYGVYDKTAAAAAGSSGTGLVTERGLYFALPSINGAHTYNSGSDFYAPTGAGTAGQVLASTAGTPSWVDQSTLVAGKATILETQRTIWGQNFNGSQNVSGDMSNVGDIDFEATGKKIGGLLYFDLTNSRIGVNTTSPTDRFSVDGDISATGGVAATGIGDLTTGTGGGGGTATGIRITSSGTRYDAVDGLITLPATEGEDNGTILLGGQSIAVHGLGSLAYRYNLSLTELQDASDVRAIEALTGTSGFLKKTAANTWALDTTSYFTSAEAVQMSFELSAGIGEVWSSLGSIAFRDESEFATAEELGVIRNYFDNSGNANNANLLGGTSKANMFSSLSSDTTDAVKLTIGGTSKSITPSTLRTSLGLGSIYSHNYSEFLTSLGTSGKTLTWSKGGEAQTPITVPYASMSTELETEAKTGQEFVYRKSPKTIKADSMRLDRIKGKTLVWNQRIYDWQGGVSSSLNPTNCSATYSNGITTVTGSSGNANFILTRGNAKAVVGHRYYHYIVYKSNVQAMVYESGGSGAFGTAPVSTSFSVFSGVALNNYASGPQGFGFYVNDATSSWEFQLKYAISIDLTLMFGSGNEPTAADFEKYYFGAFAYNEGELINNSAKAIESIGFNLWDEEWELGGYDTNSGAKTNATNRFRNKNFIPVIPNQTYYGHWPTNYDYIWVYKYDSNKQYIGYTTWSPNNALTIPSGCYYINFHIREQLNITTYSNNICLNLSDTNKNGTYEPYKKTITDLNLQEIRVKGANDTIVTYNGLDGIGNVCDEISADGRRLIKQYGKRAYQSGDADSSTMRTDGTNTIYKLTTPEVYDLVDPIPTSLPSGTTERRLPEDTADSVIAPFVADMTYGTNPGDIIASAKPWDLISGKPTQKIDKGTVTNGEWFLTTLGDTKMYIRFVTTADSFELQIADDSSNPTVTKTFSFATLSVSDIQQICV